jgi:hypothetical protein
MVVKETLVCRRDPALRPAGLWRVDNRNALEKRKEL